jgi:hypothetical protein
VDLHDHGHHHRVSAAADARFLRVALVLIVTFMVCEVVAGVVADSLALLADAGHMLTDAGALAASLVATRLVQRPATDRHSYGFFRAEILAAAANGVTLLLVAGLVVLEAGRRLVSPPTVEGGVLTVVALVGLLVNVAAMAALARANRQSLNVEGAFQHLLTDLYASLGAVVAGIVVLATGFERADPIASLFVAALVLRSAWRLHTRRGRGRDHPRAHPRRARCRRSPRPAPVVAHLGPPGAERARRRDRRVHGRRSCPGPARPVAGVPRRALRRRALDVPDRARRSRRPRARGALREVRPSGARRVAPGG